MTKSIPEKLIKSFLGKTFEDFLRYRNLKTPIFTGFIVNSSFHVKTNVTYRHLCGIVTLSIDFSWFSHIS